MQNSSGFFFQLPHNCIPIAQLPAALREAKQAWLSCVSVAAIFSSDVEDGDLVRPMSESAEALPDNVAEWKDAVWVPVKRLLNAEENTFDSTIPAFWGIAFKQAGRVLFGPTVQHSSFGWHTGDVLYADKRGKLTTTNTGVLVGFCVAPGAIYIGSSASESEISIQGMQEKIAALDSFTQGLEGRVTALGLRDEELASFIAENVRQINMLWNREILEAPDIPRIVYTLEEVETAPQDGMYLVPGMGSPSTEEADISNRRVLADRTTTARSLGSRFADVLNVKDFGAVGDGVTDDSAAVQSMASATGRIVFPAGRFALSTTTLASHMVFLPGASLVALAGHTVTISARIDAPKQELFTGEGQYVFQHLSTSGEDCREVHASWFGMFPSSNGHSAEYDISAKFQKACTALGSTRESVIHFDIGRYVMASTVTLGRAMHVHGAGIRNTIFVYLGGDYVMFDSPYTGSRLTELQVEPVSSSDRTERTEPVIRISGDTNQVIDVVINAIAKTAIHITETGYGCVLRDLRFIMASGVYLGDGARSILAQGSHLTIDNVLWSYVGKGIQYGVEIQPVSRAISNVSIRRLDCEWTCTPVHIVQDGSVNMGNVVIADVQLHTGTDAVDNAVLIENPGAKFLYGLHIESVLLNNKVATGVRIVQSGTGQTYDIHINDVCPASDSSTAIALVQTAGTLKDIFIGDTNDKTRQTPFVTKEGVMTNVYNGASIPVGAKVPLCYAQSVPNNGVMTIDLERNVYSYIALVSIGSAAYSVCACVSSATPSITEILASANFETSTAVLTGTTGNSGKTTVSASAKTFQVENRTGSSIVVNVALMIGNN